MSTTPADPSRSQLILLEQNRKDFEKILSLTRVLCDTSSDGTIDTDRDQTVLEERQHLMAEIDRRNAEMNGWAEDGERSPRDPETAARLESVQTEMRSIIAEILELDKKHAQALDVRQNAVKLELLRFQSFVKSRRAYGPGRYSGARFIDQVR